MFCYIANIIGKSNRTKASRKRIDESGTKEPLIQRSGKNRILLQLPGVKDPERIKELLGKTAKLTFRLVSEADSEFSSELVYFENSDEKINVNKRIVVSGDNLISASPKLDNQTNQAIVSFTFDRVGAKKFAKATSTGVGKKLAIILDKKVISSPNIREPIKSDPLLFNVDLVGRFISSLSLKTVAKPPFIKSFPVSLSFKLYSPPRVKD